jgi:oligosaccharide repeat unit polymerase
VYSLILFGSLVLFIAVVVFYASRPYASLYHPITLYLAFHGLVFVIRPLFAYYNHYYKIYRAYEFWPTVDDKITVILAANVGLVAFLLATGVTGAVRLPLRGRALDMARRPSLTQAFLLILLLLAPLGIASLLSTGSQWGTMRMDRATGTVINTTANGWFTEAQLLLVPLSVLFGWLFRYRWWALMPLVCFVVLRAGTGGRGPFVVACLALGLMYLFELKRRWPTPRVIALVAIVIGLFYLVGQDRGSSIRTFVSSGEISDVRARWGFMETMDFGNMEFFEYVVRTVPRETGTFGYFVDNLQIFTEPIPRKLWPGKPVGAPIKMFNLMDYGNPVGITYSLPGYGWAQAGYLGVVIWCGLWGLALGAVYARFARSGQGSFAVAAYFSFLPIFVIAFRDGQLLTILRTGVFYMSPVALWYLAARALGSAGPVKQAVRARRQLTRTTPAADAPSPRRRSLAAQVVPRAWRRRGPAQPAE